MAESTTSSRTGVQWRRITRVLWVGRRDGRHVGMIEQGKEYVATDDEGLVRGRFRDLEQAESVFDGALPEAEPAEGATPRRRRAWPYVTGGGVLVVAAAAVAGAMLIH